MEQTIKRFSRPDGTPRFDLVAAGAIFLGYVAFRLYPIIRFGDAAFGYDTGIYRRIIREYAPRMGDRADPPFAFTAFSNFLSLFGNSLDEIAVGWYVITAALLFWAVYAAIAAAFDRRTALLGVALLTTAITQSEFYSWYYYRNLLALALTFVAILFWQTRSWLTVPVAIALGSIHPLTLVPLMVAMAAVALVDRTQRRQLLLMAGAVTAACWALNWNEWSRYVMLVARVGPILTQLPEDAAELSGQFITGGFYLRAALIYLPFSLFGFIRGYRRAPLFSALLVTAGLLMVSPLLFRNRFFVIFDAAAIVFAAHGLSRYLLTLRPPIPRYLFAAGYGLLLLTVAIQDLRQRTPLLPQQEVLAVRELAALAPDVPVLVLSSAMAPWVYGFAPQPVIAPGMFELNQWNKDEWVTFWTAEEPAARHALLDRYDYRQMYVFVGSQESIWAERFSRDQRFSALTPHVWQYQ